MLSEEMLGFGITLFKLSYFSTHVDMVSLFADSPADFVSDHEVISLKTVNCFRISHYELLAIFSFSLKKP